jgi:hypothetical protein
VATRTRHARGTPTALSPSMVATRITPMPSPELSPTAQAFVGDALELVIYSVEAIRERVGKLATLGLRRRDAR